jgi:peptide/nickel transport system permease protein
MAETSYLQQDWARESKRYIPPGLPTSLTVGIIGILLLALLFLIGPHLLPYAPNDQDLLNRLQAPSLYHWFGTDNYGRDQFSRILHAGRMDLQIALLASLFAFLFGTIVGALAGLYEGLWDTLLMRILDVLIAFPDLVLVIAIVGLLGMDLYSLYIALGLVGWAPYARLVRGEVLSAKQRDYVLAARALGCNNSWLLWRHLLPHSISAAIVYATSSVTFNILAITSLGYLGVGIRPPQAEWGAMIAEGRSFILSSPGLVLFPGLMLTLTGLTFSLLGDGIMALLQPVQKNEFLVPQQN